MNLLALGASLAAHASLLLLLPASASHPAAPAALQLLLQANAQPAVAPAPPQTARPEAHDKSPAPANEFSRMRTDSQGYAASPIPAPAAQRQPADSGLASSVAPQAGAAAIASAAISGDAVPAGDGTSGVIAASGASTSTSQPAPASNASGDGTENAAPPAPPSKPKPLTPPPAPPAPTVDVQALLRDYAAGVKSAILRQKDYPELAERLGHEGAVKVGFAVAADGSLLDANVRSSSGYDELDDAAIAAVRDAAPFAAIPEDADKSELSLTITLRFSLQ